MLLDNRGDQSPFSPHYRTPISRLREEPLSESRQYERYYPSKNRNQRHNYKISEQLPSCDETEEQEQYASTRKRVSTQVSKSQKLSEFQKQIITKEQDQLKQYTDFLDQQNQVIQKLTQQLLEEKQQQQKYAKYLVKQKQRQLEFQQFQDTIIQSQQQIFSKMKQEILGQIDPYRYHVPYMYQPISYQQLPIPSQIPSFPLLPQPQAVQLYPSQQPQPQKLPPHMVFQTNNQQHKQYNHHQRNRHQIAKIDELLKGI